MHSQILLGSLHLSPGLVVFCGVARGVLAELSLPASPLLASSLLLSAAACAHPRHPKSKARPRLPSPNGRSPSVRFWFFPGASIPCKFPPCPYAPGSASCGLSRLRGGQGSISPFPAGGE